MEANYVKYTKKQFVLPKLSEKLKLGGKQKGIRWDRKI